MSIARPLGAFARTGYDTVGQSHRSVPPRVAQVGLGGAEHHGWIVVEDLQEVMCSEDEARLGVCSREATTDEPSKATVLLESGDRLRYVRTLLPRHVRLLVPTSPLAGQVVTAEGALRRNGTIWLTVVVADGTTRSVEVENTDLLGQLSEITGPGAATTVSVEALRELKRLTETLANRVVESSSRERRGR